MAEAVELVRDLLRSDDVPVNTVSPLKVLVAAGEDNTESAAEMNKTKAGNAESETVMTITARRQGVRFNDVKKHHAEKVIIWKAISAETVNGLINYVKVLKEDGVKIFTEKNLIFARFEKIYIALQTLVYANMKKKETLPAPLQRLWRYSRRIARQIVRNVFRKFEK